MSKIPFREFYKLGLTPEEAKDGGRMSAEIGAKFLEEQIDRETALNNPNELVQVAFIRSMRSINYQAAALDKQIVDLRKVWEKAKADADSEEMLWTPVLDAVAEIILHYQTSFPRKEVAAALLAELEAEKVLVAQMCGNYTVSDLLEASKSFKCKEINKLVFSEGREARIEILDDIKEPKEKEEAAACLINNPSLPTEDVIELALSVFRLRKLQKGEIYKNTFDGLGIRASVARLVEARGGLAPEWGENREWHINPAAVGRMLLAHPRVTTQILETIFLDNRQPTHARVEAIFHPTAKREAKKWLAKITGNSRRVVWSSILSSKKIGGALVEEMARVWSVAEDGSGLAAQLINHPKLSEQSALNLALKGEERAKTWGVNGITEIRAAIAKRAIARTDKELWSALQKTQAAEVLANMVEGAQTTQELDRAVKRLHKSSVARLLEVLWEIEMRPGVHLSQKLLAPVLIKGTPAEREATIKILGRWGAAKFPEASSGSSQGEGSKPNKESGKVVKEGRKGPSR